MSHRPIEAVENPQLALYDSPTYFRSSVTKRFRMRLRVLLFLLVVTLCPAALFELAVSAEVTSPLSGTIKIVNSPPKRDKRYSLGNWGVCDSNVQRYQYFQLYGSGGPITTTTSQTDTVKYLGRETVTVPAGTFDICKFDENNGSSTVWMGARIAAYALIKNGTITLELKTGTLNGSTIRP